MTPIRRRSLLEMLTCVLLVAVLAGQPALGGNRGSDKRAQSAAGAAPAKAKKPARGGAKTRAPKRRASRAAQPPAAAVPDPGPPATPEPKPKPKPEAPTDVADAEPEEGDDGAAPAADPLPAPTPAVEESPPTPPPPPEPEPAEAPDADAPKRDSPPSAAAARPVSDDAPVPSAQIAPPEAVASSAPVLSPGATQSAPAASSAPALTPPPGAGAGPPAGSPPSGAAPAATNSGTGGAANPTRRDPARPSATPGAGTTATGPTSLADGAGPPSALSEAARIPATEAIARDRSDVVREGTGVRTSRPVSGNGSVDGLDERSPFDDVVDSARDLFPYAWILLVTLGVLVLLLGANSVIAAARTRRLRRQREKLMEDIGLLQSALLPAVPPRLGALLTSVAYRPADGPAAGGDFYDAFALPDGQVALLLGDVSGHGRQALAKTTLVRFTVRAHLEAGMSPREAIAISGRSLDGRLSDDFSTVIAAIHDPVQGTLTYASAGHPPPLVIGAISQPSVTASSAPPIGAGFPTGQRQTVLPMPEGTTVAIYSDGLLEARIDGKQVGADLLAQWLRELGPGATAQGLLDLVVQRADRITDDLAAVVLHTAPGAIAPAARIEQLKLDVLDVEGPDLDGFLEAAGVSTEDRVLTGRRVSEELAITGGVVVEIRTGEHPMVSVAPIGDDSAAGRRQRARAR